MNNLTLKRTLNFIPAKNKGIKSLLKTVGVPESIIGQRNRGFKIGGSFWIRNQDKVEYIMEDIKTCYLKTIKEYHPDKENGNLEKSKIINSAWREIKKRFNQRINPKLYIKSGAGNNF